MQGLKDAMANPQEAGTIMNKHHRHVDADIGDGRDEDRRQIRSAGLPLGVLDPVRVKKTIDIVGGAYVLKDPVTPDDVYAPGFVAN